MTNTSSLPKKLTRIALRTLMGAIALVVLILIGSILYLDSIARAFLAPSLFNAGLHLESISGLRLSSQRIHIDRMDFRLSDQPQVSSVENVSIHFHWQELLNAKIRQLHIERAFLALATTASEQTGEQAPHLPNIPPMAQLRQQFDNAPLNSLLVDALTIDHYLEQATLSVQRQENNLQLDLSAQASHLGLTLRWESDDQTQHPHKLVGSLTLSDDQRLALSNDFTLAQQESLLHLSSNTRLQTNISQAVLTRWGLLPTSIGTLSGEFVFDTRITASLMAAQELQFEIAVPAAQTLAIELSGLPDASMERITWTNIADSSITGKVQWPELSFNFNADAPSARLLLSSSQEPASTLDFSATPLHMNCITISQCTGILKTTLQLDTMATADLRAHEILSISELAIDISPEQTQLSFGQGSRIEAGTIEFADTTLLHANLLAQDSLRFNYYANGDWQIDSNAIDLLVPDLIASGKSSYFTVAMHELHAEQIAANGNEPQLLSNMQIRNIGSDWLPYSLRKPEANLSMTANASALSLSGTLNLADREIMQIEALWNLAENIGQLQATTPELSFAQGKQSFSQFFFRPPFNADLIGGTLQASASLHAQQDSSQNWSLNGPITLDLASISGFYEEVGVINLSTQLEGTLINSTNFNSDENQSLSIERIDIGLPVENIAVNYSIDTLNTLAKIESFEATLFRGKVRSDNILYDWSAETNQAEISLERLDLSRLLDLAAYDAVRATGFISGNLPITLTNLTPSIGQGNLFAEIPGGSIHYSSLGGGTGSNAALNFVNDALSNYQYNLLETTVNYQPSGELDLGVRLQGLNPDMNNGQRINLNLNINDNIPALLQSLQSGRSIADAIERALQ